MSACVLHCLTPYMQTATPVRVRRHSCTQCAHVVAHATARVACHVRARCHSCTVYAYVTAPMCALARCRPVYARFRSVHAYCRAYRHSHARTSSLCTRTSLLPYAHVAAPVCARRRRRPGVPVPAVLYTYRTYLCCMYFTRLVVILALRGNI